MSRYDFEDWLKGTISGNQVREEYLKYETTGEGLPPEVYCQILEAQEKTFDQAVIIMTDKLKEKASGKPAEWLELEIAQKESFLSDHPDLVQKQLEGKKRLLHITGRDYKKAQRIWEKHNKGERVSLIIADGKTPSKLQRACAYKQYLPFLKASLAKLETRGDIDPVYKDTAIKLTIDDVDNKIKCQEALEKYVELSKENPGRSTLNIYEELDEKSGGNLPQSTFFNWVSKYKDKLNTLKYAHEK